jgi:glycine oxidase
VDVLIVGGGVIGLSIARELRKRGVEKITIPDKRQAGREASWAAAGILAPQVEADEPDDFFRLCHESNNMYPRFAAELLNETGVDVELDKSGILYVGFNEDDISEFERRTSWQKAAGLNAEILSRDDVLKLEPLVSPNVIGGVLFADEGQVENRKLVAALIAYARSSSIDIAEKITVDSVVVERDRAVGVVASGERIDASTVVICAGAWTSQIATAASLPRVKPMRGQMLCYRPDQRKCRRVIFSRRGYLVPRTDGRLLAGATVEDVGFDRSVTDDAIAQLERVATELIPSLKDVPVADKWAGLRPFADGGRPIIGPVPNVDGLFIASGHFRNGILLAPITAALIADDIFGHSNSHFSNSFSPNRFDAARK